MAKYTGRFYTPVAIGMLVLAVACGDKGKKADSLAADSALTRDLAMAGADTAAKPQLHDVPAATTTKAPTSTTASKTTTTTTTTTTPPPAPSGKMIGAGTALSLVAGTKICTNTGHVGDTWTAVTTAPVTQNGAKIPRNATVTFRVTQLKRSEHTGDPIVMTFEAQSVRFGGKTYPLSGALSGLTIDRVRNEPKSADAKKVVGGAAIGAIAGQILGKSTKATVIGAAAGAAVGAGAAVATANYEGCVNAGSGMTLTLSQPVEVAADAPRRP